MTSMLDGLCASTPKPHITSGPAAADMPINGTTLTETNEEKLGRVCKVLAASAAGLAVLSEDLNRSVLRRARPDEDTCKRRTNQIATLNRNVFIAGEQIGRWDTKVEMREAGQEVNKRIDDMLPQQRLASKVSRLSKDVFDFTRAFDQNYLYFDPDLRLFDATETVNLRKRRIDFTLSSMEQLERDLKRLKEMDDVVHVSEAEGAQEVEKARDGGEAETDD